MKRLISALNVLTIPLVFFAGVTWLTFEIATRDDRPASAPEDPIPGLAPPPRQFLPPSEVEFSPFIFNDPALARHDEKCRLRWAWAIALADADPEQTRPGFICVCRGGN